MPVHDGRYRQQSRKQPDKSNQEGSPSSFRLELSKNTHLFPKTNVAGTRFIVFYTMGIAIVNYSAV